MKFATRWIRVSMSSLLMALLFVVTAHAQAGDQYTIKNPLDAKFSTVPGFIAGALHVLVVVALPIISLFMVISGFMFVLARGNSSQLEKAKRNFLYVVLGALLILGAWVLAELIGGTVIKVLGT